MTVTLLQTTQYRLAQHYLNKLRTAATVVQQGQAGVAYGLNLFDQDWYQIKHWQAWSAQRSAEGVEWTRLCKDFPLAGREVLVVRHHAADHAAWLEIALEAARQLHDSDAEGAILNELNITCYRLGALEKVEQSARQLLKLGEAAHDPLSITRGFNGLATLAAERGMYAEAERYYRRALEMSIELGNDAETGRALNGLGNIPFYLGDYQNAYHYFSHYLELMEAGGKKSEYCSALLAVGDALMGLKDYAAAEKFIRRAIAMSRMLGFQRLLGVGLINLGTWAVEQDQLELASSCFEEGIQAVRDVGTRRQIIRGLSLLGYTRFRQKNFAEALAYLHEGLQMARTAGLPRYTCNLLRNLTDTYLALNDLDAARTVLHESLIIAEKLGSSPEKVKILSSAVAYYHCLGWAEQAAVWAGSLIGNLEIDRSLFEPVCLQLEVALGKHAYHQALEDGKVLTLNDVLAEVLGMIEHLSEEHVLEV